MKKQKKFLYWYHLPILFLLLNLFFVGCRSKEISSLLRDRSIIIDGNYSEWKRILNYYKKNNAIVGIGIMNDKHFLYLCLVTENKQIQKQIWEGGLTVWLDPEGKKNKTLGIHYPLGIRKNDITPQRLTLPAKGKSDTLQPHPISEWLYHPSSTQLEIRGSEEEVVQSLDINQLKGDEVKLNNLRETLVYELKVPLTSDKDYSFALVPQDSTIGIGLETDALDKNPRQTPQEHSRMPDRDFGGREEGRRGGRRGGGPGGPHRPADTPSPLKIWLKVHLVSLNDTCAVCL